MRVMECNLCGEALGAANDDELFTRAREHMDESHAGEGPDEDALRSQVADEAYEATDS